MIVELIIIPICPQCKLQLDFLLDSDACLGEVKTDSEGNPIVRCNCQVMTNSDKYWVKINGGWRESYDSINYQEARNETLLLQSKS